MAINVTTYPVSIYWSDEDKGFIAIPIDLPGCSAFGETQEDALSEVHDAISGWLHAAIAAKNPIPPPSRVPEPHQHSGKVLLRLPKSLHTTLVKEAGEEGVSLNQHMVHVLAARR